MQISIDNNAAGSNTILRTARRTLLWTTSTLVLVLLLVDTGAFAQRPPRHREVRLPKIEARYDAVVLIADAKTGKLLGGTQIGEAHARQYHPASLFKLPIAVAGLSSGQFAAGKSYTCRGRDTIGGTAYDCWLKGGHGRLDLRGAISHSCNLYFRHYAQGLSRTQIVQAARSLGMVPAVTSAGTDPSRGVALTDENLLGDAFNVSPFELLLTATTLASHGRLSPTGLALPVSRFRPIYEGLIACVAEGTGKDAKTPKFSMAGKTGTTMMPEAVQQTVGWFIGYAPASAPKYSICVMVRKARGSDAARIAREALEEVL
jgi:cell division protein FtsI/penicillin-binding protein 2